MTDYSGNQTAQRCHWADRCRDLFAILIQATKELNTARAAGRFEDPSAIARHARDLYELMREAARQRFSSPLEGLSGWQLDLYRSAMSYAHLRATAQAGMQWAALLRLIDLCTNLPSED